MNKTITSNPRWMRVDTVSKVNQAVSTVMKDTVNTWNGPGMTDRHGRPLIMVGFRPTPSDYAENKYGLVFSGSMAGFLRDAALEQLKAAFSKKSPHLLPVVWQPKEKE